MTGHRRRPEPSPEQLLRLRHEAKRQLRTRIGAVRGALPAEARERRSLAIADHVINHEAYGRAEVLTAYIAMRGEVNPRRILDAARAAGKVIALPRIDWSTETMLFYRWDDGDELEESGMGFLQPLTTAPSIADEIIDLVLTPALAIDLRGHRIGFGKGFYDRFLERLPDATSVALIFDFQRLAEVPDTPGDVPVQFWATSKGIESPD
ncbi:MAG: 5-formyltetrahydrofolate cyclo-ligase [Deltaproteobacteria bacterium]|nr:MAG: 5-formyltetrahydrofolate cyclo-ligase [Deltaproteobacteria bacterium]